jgi:hypothetical protein
VHRLASCIALLSFVGLRGLIPAPCLLLVLHWGVWRVPLWASIGIVTKLSALEASSGGRIRRCHGPHRCANWSSLLTLLGNWAWSLRDRTLKLLSRLLELLSRTLGLLLPKVSTRFPKRNGVFGGGLKCGRDALPNCPELAAFLFCSPSSLRFCSKRMAASTSC